VAHPLLIAAHATCAIAAFVLGLVVIWQPPTRVTAAFRAYLATLSLMVLFLVAVILVDLAHLETPKRIVFLALLLLAVYMTWRGWQAAQELRQQTGNWRDAYIEDVGFTLITLFDGFVIVAALDLGAPIWLVLVIGALGIIAGRIGVVRIKSRTMAAAPLAAQGG
jgi:hypothetical protein